MMMLGGVAKEELVDKPRRYRQNILKAKQEELSPWTRMQPQQFQQGDPLGTPMQFAFTGLQMGQNIDQAKAAKETQDWVFTDIAGD